LYFLRPGSFWNNGAASERGPAAEGASFGIAYRAPIGSLKVIYIMKDPMDPVTGRNRAIRSDITPLLRVEALKILREGPILRRIDWQVQPGEHWVILGANGSGKTSLISALAGHLAPTSGQVRVLGETFGHTDWRELRKSIGLVSPYVSERIGSEETVLDITLGGRYATIGLYSRAGVAERTRATEVLAGVGCSALARRSWATLSQGERKRVLIARSLMCDYRVLILDEPCAFLDPSRRRGGRPSCWSPITWRKFSPNSPICFC